jgi:lipoprotein-anchoring transpeptidase ErfK/SrfK
MQRRAFHTALTTFLLLSPAFAGPLDLTAQSRTQPSASPSRASIGAIFSAPAPAPQEPAPVRIAANALNLGGGFIEMLFRGPGGSPHSAPQSDPMTQPYGQPPRGAGQEPHDPTQAEVDPRFLPQEVRYDGRENPGTVVINTRERFLYLVQGNGRAMRYGIGVGRPGFTWAGSHTITNMREWPDGRPPPQMLRRQPNLPRYMRGGPDNPLGARAMYLGSTIYRIHGSNEPWTIGHAVSSGCIRMRNQDVIDLYQRVRVGTRVVVI